MLFIAFVLQVIFFLLKVTGAVGWDWPVVLIPLWFILIFAFFKLVVSALDLLDKHLTARKRRKLRQARGW